MMKLKLKKWVICLLYSLFFIGLVLLIATMIMLSSTRLEQVSKSCDQANNKTCSYYEIKNFRK